MVKDKPLIHTAEENKDKAHYHNVSGEILFDGSRIIDLLFVIKQLKDRCTVCGELQNIAHLETENIIGFYLKCVWPEYIAFILSQCHTKCGKKRECKTFDVNTRCAGGKRHYFLGKMQSISL